MPAERTISTLYTVLLDVAPRVMGRAMLPDVALERDLAQLNDEIEAAVRKPVEGRRLINDEEKLLARCLLRILEARRAGEDDRVMTWRQIAGVLVPVVQKHFGEALEATLRARPETSSQDYATRR